MKISSEEHHVKGSHGLQEARSFQIETNALAFKMLSSGLYSDKIGAVLREIGCNAADAHTEFGTPDLPIHVKLPNRIDNQFFIRDWGPGLSHEDVMGLYTTYFKSTKGESNAYTGAFGLGSKSPFSYTDSFAVVSVHDSKKRTYSAHLDNTGSPTIALLTTEDAPADWQHGLSIGFPVKPMDYVSFQNKAQEIYKWFRVPPKIEGAMKIEPVEIEIDRGFFMKVRAVNHGVVMGNVFYPLNATQILGLSNLGKYAFDFGGLVLRVDIGDVAVAGSRESLQYDKLTNAFLDRKLTEAVRIIGSTVADDLRKFDKAPWLDKCRTTAVYDKWDTPQNYRSVNWENIFHAAGMNDIALLVRSMGTRSFPLPGTAGDTTMFRVLTAGKKNVQHVIVVAGKRERKYGDGTVYIVLKEKTTLYYGKATHALSRVRAKVEDGTTEQAIMIVPKPGETEANMRAEYAEVLAKFHGMPTQDISSLLIPPAALTRSGKGTKRAKISSITPVPSLKVFSLDKDGKPSVVDLSQLAPSDQHYMCKGPNYGYEYGDRNVRLFDKTADLDKHFGKRVWDNTWTSFTRLQDELGLVHTKVCPLPSAGEIRQVDLPKRGWKSTHAVIEEWIKSQKVRDAVAAAAAKWRPTINLAYNAVEWLAVLVKIKQEIPTSYMLLEPELAASPLKLNEAVDEITLATSKAGQKAGRDEPIETELYSALALKYSAPPIAAVGKRNYITPSDLEKQITNTHPMTNVFDADELKKVAQHHPGRLRDFAKIVFST